MKIAMNGKMGSGKSTVSHLVQRELGLKLISIGSEIKPLANTLVEDSELFKEKIAILLPESKATREAIEKVVDDFHQRFKHAVWEKDNKGGYIKNDSYRVLLQNFPMMIRRTFGNEIFLKVLIHREGTIEGKRYIIDDLRLPEEKRYLESLGFDIIRLDLSKEEQERRLLKDYGEINEDAFNHPTEIALDSEVFDLRVNAEQTPERIAKEIVSYMKERAKRNII